jgi:sec-independent protein translocase protein TatC
MSPANEPPDPDDLFSHTRMSLGDHIEELRGALVRAGKGFLIALIIGFFVAEPALTFIEYPVKSQLEEIAQEREKKAKKDLEDGTNPALTKSNQRFPVDAVIDRKKLAEAVGVELPKAVEGGGASGSADEGKVHLTFYITPSELRGPLQAFDKEVNPHRHLVALTVTESFIVWCKVAIYAGLVLSSPWIFWQLWMFVAAGLYPHEKRHVYTFLPFSLGLFVVGVLLCQFVVLPNGIRYLLWFNEWLGVEAELRLNDWLGFAIMLPVIMGLAFQLPLVMYFLYKIGIFEVETYIASWRMALFVLTIMGFLLAPSPDPFNGLCMAVPLCLLYFVGIWLCKIWPNPKLDLEEPDESEMIEV